MDKKYKNPVVRFKGFTEDWENKVLGDFGKVAMNKRIFKFQTSDNGEIPFFKIGSFGGEPDAFISRKLFEEYKSKYPYPNKGDILISASGSIGRVVEFLGKEEYFQDSNIVWLDHNENINNQFLKQYYSIIKWNGLEGSTIKRLYNKSILTTSINIPTPNEQKQIGSFFQNQDNLITLHQKKYDKLVILKKAMLVKMFPKNGALLPEIRFKGFTENWKREILSELGDFKSNGVDKKIISTEHPVNLLNYMDVYNSRYLDANNCKGLMQVTAKTSQLNDNNVLKNDVFFTPSSETSEDIGRVMVIENDLPNTVYSYHLMRFRPKLNVFYTFFPNYCFASEHVRKQLVLSAQGVQRFTLSKPAFEELTVLIPSLKEQQKIGDYFKNLDNQIALNKTQLKKLNNIKKACFSKMFVAQD